MGTRPALWLLVSATVLITGCPSSQVRFVDYYRHPEMNNGKEDKVVTVLSSYVNCIDNCEKELASVRTELSFERCVRNALIERRSDIDLLPARVFREKVFVGKADTPRTPAELSDAIKDPETRMRIDALAVRYIVLLNVHTDKTDSEFYMDGADMLLIGGVKWMNTSQFLGTILDVETGEEIGRLTARNGHYKSAGVFILIILPIPYYLPSAVESATCRDFAFAMDDLFANRQ